MATTRAYREANREKINAYKRAYSARKRAERKAAGLPSRDDDQAKRHAEYMRQRRAQMTPEQKAEEREKARIRMAERYAAMTVEQRREKWQKNKRAYEAMSDEKKAARVRAERLRRRKIREAKRAAMEDERKAKAAIWRKENRAALNSAPEAIYRRIRAAIPRTLFADIRDDIANDIAIALLDGEIGLDEIETSVRDCLSRHFRQREWNNVWSLDAIIPRTDGVRRIDTIAA